MLTVIRELAEAAERRRRAALASCCAPSSRRRGGARAHAGAARRCCARRASSTPAAPACSRSSAASPPSSRASRCRRRRAEASSASTRCTRSSREFRYCTVFVVEGEGLDADGARAELEPLGDSLLVVGDATALKVHVHTDDPGAALSLGVALGTLERVEIANMHAQTAQREERLLRRALPDAPPRRPRWSPSSRARATGALFESLGRRRIVDGGRTMNPSAAEHPRRDRGARPRPRWSCSRTTRTSIIAAEQAAGSRRSRCASCRRARSRRASRRSSRSTRARLGGGTRRRCDEALEAVATGAVTVASRDAEVERPRVRKGECLGLVDGEPVVAARSFEEVARAVLGRLLAKPRDVLTLLTGEEAPGAAGSRGARAGASRPRARGARGRAAALPAALSARVGCAARAPTDPHPARRGQPGLPRGARAAARAAHRLEVVASVGDGEEAVPACREHRPDVVLMDYRLPGLDGVRGDARPCARRAPTSRSSCLTALRTRRGDAGADRGGRGRVPDEGPGARRDRRRDPRGRRGRGAREARPPQNTAVVLDSTADFPEAPQRFSELARRAALRPLRRRELPGLRRARARRSSTRGCARRPSCRRRRSRRRGDFLDVYEELAGYERIFSLHDLARSSPARTQSAQLAARAAGGDRVRVVDSGTASAAIAMLALAVQRRLERGTTDEEIEELVAQLRRDARAALHRRHARVPRAGRPHRQGGARSPASC